MGLGPYPHVSLKAAREMAADALTPVEQGKDPISQRNAEQHEAERNLHFLGEVARDCL